MKQFKVSRAISVDKLKDSLFKITKGTKNSFVKKYSLRRELPGDSHVDIVIKQIGKRFFYNNKKGSIIYVGEQELYGCRPSDLEKHPGLGFKQIVDGYLEEMNILADEGILTRVYKPKKNK